MSLLNLFILFVASNFVTGLVVAFHTEICTAIKTAFVKTRKTFTTTWAYLTSDDFLMSTLADTLFILGVITGIFLIIGLPFICILLI